MFVYVYVQWYVSKQNGSFKRHRNTGTSTTAPSGWKTKRPHNLKPVYSKRQWLIWSANVNACITVYLINWGYNPFFGVTNLIY